MVFIMPAKEFKNLTLNHEDKESNRKRCYCYVPVSSIPAHLRNYVVDAEDETLSVERIADWFEYEPEHFHLLAPKIILHTKRFVFDNRKNKLKFELNDLEYEGVIGGFNALLAVLDNRKDCSSDTPDGEVYIELELLNGLSKEEVKKIAEMRKY